MQPGGYASVLHRAIHNNEDTQCPGQPKCFKYLFWPTFFPSNYTQTNLITIFCLYR